MNKLTWRVDNKGMGGFLAPIGHATHSYSIYHDRCYMSLGAAVNDEWLPEDAKNVARKLLAENPGILTDEWVKQVYAYFHHCYSPDGTDHNYSNCIVDQTNNQPAENHLAYLHIRQYFPNYQVRLDLI